MEICRRSDIVEEKTETEREVYDLYGKCFRRLQFMLRFVLSTELILKLEQISNRNFVKHSNNDIYST
jgi:hypothetical protein